MRHLLVFTTVLLAGSAFAQSRRGVPPATACNTANAECREDCTMEFGASIRLRAKLGRCLNQCRRKHSTCTERWTELNQAGLDTSGFDSGGRSSRSKQAPVERTRFDPPQDEAPASPPPHQEAVVPPPPEDEPAEASTRTRFAEPAPAPDHDAPPAEETEEATSTPATTTAAKQQPASPPPPPPPPKKEKEHDISEWEEGVIEY